MAGINGNQLSDLTITRSKLAYRAITADAGGRAVIADGYFSANDIGRAKVANGFITPLMMNDHYVEKIVEPIIDRNTKFYETDEAAPNFLNINNEMAINMSNSVDTEFKVVFTIPELYNEASDILYTLIMSPSTGETGNTFDISVEYRINGAAAVVFGTTALTPDVAAEAQSESASILNLGLSTINRNDRVLLKIKRLGSTDTHTGNMRIFEVRQKVYI